MNINLTYNTKKYLKVFLIISGIFIFLKITMKFEIFAEFLYARGISRLLTVIFQNMSNALPFSVYELLIIALVVLLIVYIIKAVISKKEISDLRAYRFLYSVVLFISVEVLMYNAVATALYNRTSVTEPLKIEVVKDVTDEEMTKAAEYYIDSINAIAETMERDSAGNIISPYTFDELNNLLNKEYKKLDSRYFHKNYLRLKEIKLSVPMTYTGITGAYVGILGEGSINTNIPSYTLPVTMAHEMAHSKGVFQENEANFTAYYLCIMSDDKYLNYCGLMYASAICYNKVDNKEIRKGLLDRYSDKVLIEYSNASKFYEGYEGVISTVSDFINNLYLKSAGVKEGTLSYSLTDKYLVSLYEKIN